MRRILYMVILISSHTILASDGNNHRETRLTPHQMQVRGSIRPSQERQRNALTSVDTTHASSSRDENDTMVDDDTHQAAHALIYMHQNRLPQPQNTSSDPGINGTPARHVHRNHGQRARNRALLQRLQQSQVNKIQQLYTATRARDVQRARSILQEGVNRDILKRWGTRLLHTALSDDSDIRTKYNFIALLVTHGANPNIADNTGQNVLHHVMRKAQNEDISDNPEMEYRDIIKFLICNNTDLNKQDKNGTTPLHIAAASEQDMSDVIRIGAINNADINIRDKNDNLPIHGVNNIATARALLEHGSSATQINKKRNNPLHELLYITRRIPKFYEKTLSIPRDMITEYITRGTSLSHKGETQKTPLLLAFQPHMVYELVSYGADINSTDTNGNTLLAITSNIGIANACIQCGADMNLKNKCRETPLHKAVKRNRPDLCALLLRHGARTDIRNKQKNTAFDAAFEQSGSELDKATLYTMIQHGGLDINQKDRDGNTYLHKLALHTHKKKDSIIALLSEGADITCQNKAHKTPRTCTKNKEKRRIFAWVEQLHTMSDDTTLPQPIHTSPGIHEYKIMIGQGYPNKAAAWLRTRLNMTQEKYISLMHNLQHSHVPHAHEAAETMKNRYENQDYALGYMEHLISRNSPFKEQYCVDMISRYKNHVDQSGNTLLHTIMRHKTEKDLDQIVPFIARPIMQTGHTSHAITPHNAAGKTPIQIGKKYKHNTRCKQLKNARNVEQATRYICREKSYDERTPIYNRIMAFITGFAPDNTEHATQCNNQE